MYNTRVWKMSINTFLSFYHFIFDQQVFCSTAAGADLFRSNKLYCGTDHTKHHHKQVNSHWNQLRIFNITILLLSSLDCVVASINASLWIISTHFFISLFGLDAFPYPRDAMNIKVNGMHFCIWSNDAFASFECSVCRYFHIARCSTY